MPVLNPTAALVFLFTTALAVPALWAPKVGQEQEVLGSSAVYNGKGSSDRKLTGRFLHITDIHPDPFYVVGSNPDNACHHGHGAAGHLGAEISACDSPLSLVNSTFNWLKTNLQDEIDFVVWTGDSARHDNDERIPRNTSQIRDQNSWVLDKFREVWGVEGGDGQPSDGFEIPIVPTFGNNDILPHNIMMPGPNDWTDHYESLWRRLIPPPQRHSFIRGGWFYVEVVPNRLAVFSLNTMYFFGNNAGVDGCNDTDEPGYEQFEWLRIQLQMLRERGVKAILTGHVPPARNDQKQMWTESCWQKYAVWVKQYRDVVIGGLWGHMNVEHFFLQDFDEIIWDIETDALVETGDSEDTSDIVSKQDEKLTASIPQELKKRDASDKLHIEVSNPNYLNALREQFSDLPSEPSSKSQPIVDPVKGPKKSKKPPQEKYEDSIGGPYAERFAFSFVSASIVPNFFPTIRVFEYNITGLADASIARSEYAPSTTSLDEEVDWRDTEELKLMGSSYAGPGQTQNTNVHIEKKTKKKRKHKKKKGKKKKPHFVVPSPPSPTTGPGPAYSPQPLSLVGYTQYYANLTKIQRNKSAEEAAEEFGFEIEYDTRAEDDVYGLKPDDGGLNVRNMLRLASRIGEFKPKGDNLIENSDETSSNGEDSEGEGEGDATDSDEDDDNVEIEKKKHRKKKHKKKKKRQKIINKTWFAFVERALVSSVSRERLHDDYGRLPE